ncbi:MAG: DNA-3-methyladenine glycosylase I [Phototrophicales bacterium]|nr:MAG: DNA-3-methyladenine glycosylase I [Phototrophicales bacterium]
MSRCEWVTDDPLYIAYHDQEWGVPVHEDRRWFEKICLEGAQAGLSWITILKRRENYRAAFDNFDPHIVVHYDQAKIEALLQNTGIIRNRLKIQSTIKNARAFLQVQEEFGSFDTFIWEFVGGQPKINCFQTLADVPTTTPEAQALSKALKKRGFSFVGPTICYAMMQSCGMVNDHTAQCYLYPCNTSS